MKKEKLNILDFAFSIFWRRLFLLSSPVVLHLEPFGNNIKNEAVILIHGLMRTGLSMIVPALFFRSKGYTVFIYDYRSTRFFLSKHAQNLTDFISKINNSKYNKIHFFTHSLGGIILRSAFAKFATPFPNGRAVMLVPPNKGSRKASFFSNFFLLPKLLKPLCEIRNSKDAVIFSIPPPSFEHGIIAAELDAKVKIEESKTETMSDFLTVKSFHSFLMNRKDVLNASLNFFCNGKFKIVI